MSPLPLALDAVPSASNRLFNWPRFRLWLAITLLWALFRTLSSETTLGVWLLRCGLVTALGVFVFALFDRWPARLPRWLPRWVLQLASVVVVMPGAAYLGYAATLATWDIGALGSDVRNGWMVMSFMGTLLGPWIALAALLRRSEARAREQSLAFQLQRSELERSALDARLRLLQAQLEPHFLFNTLAHLRSLLRKAGSGEATDLLDSLIAYLRAAVPPADDTPGSFAREQQLVTAYLELMQRRIPDRLAHAITFDAAALPLHCPPMLVLTLVENAVKHGIDPAEGGGRIDVSVRVDGAAVVVRVVDTGVGLPAGGARDGTGLANVRQRLALAFGADAGLQLSPHAPHGAVAEVRLPAVRGGPR